MRVHERNIFSAKFKDVFDIRGFFLVNVEKLCHRPVMRQVIIFICMKIQFLLNNETIFLILQFSIV